MDHAAIDLGRLEAGAAPVAPFSRVHDCGRVHPGSGDWLNAVVCSVLNAFIIRPLDVPNPESLYGIWRTADATMYESYPDYLDLRDRNRSFDT